MRAAVAQAGFPAAIAEPIAEAAVAERLAELRHKESQIACRARVDDAQQLRQDRKLKRDRIAVAVLMLDEVQPSGLHMLAAEDDHV